MLNETQEYLYENSNYYGNETDNDHHIDYEEQSEPVDDVYYKSSWNEGSNKKY